MEITREFLENELAGIEQQLASAIQARARSAEAVPILSGAKQTCIKILQHLGIPDKMSPEFAIPQEPDEGATPGYDDVRDENGDPLDGPH